jgi:hypothetical protein
MLKAQRRQREIQETVKNLLAKEKTQLKIVKDLAYVTADIFDEYIHDIKIVQQFAVLNRKAMIQEILENIRVHDHS